MNLLQVIRENWIAFSEILLFAGATVGFFHLEFKRHKRRSVIACAFSTVINIVKDLMLGHTDLPFLIRGGIYLCVLIFVFYYIDVALRKTYLGSRYDDFIVMWVVSCIVNICIMGSQWRWHIFDEITDKFQAVFLCGIIFCEIFGFMFYSLVINSRLQRQETLSDKVFYVIRLIAHIIIALTNITEAVRLFDLSSFIGINSYLDSLYFVIVSFTTVGYGDIHPVSVSGKITAILISLTSMLTLVIFVSSYMYNILINNPRLEEKQNQ